MRFGFFDDERREYVITRPDPPLPWINYLGSEDLFGIITNTGGGYTFYGDPRLRRLTRYRYNNVPPDTGARYLYLRDESGAFWSPTWAPTRTDLDAYHCRHGLGYTAIGSQYRGIEADITFFVPLGDTVEVWRAEITNHRNEVAELSLFSAVEFALWDAWDDATNYQRNLNTGEVEVVDGVIFHTTEYRERRNHFAFFSCSEEPAGFDTQREAFLGPYRGWDSPVVVERGTSADSIAHGWSPIGSHQIDLSLGPGETRTVVFALGYHENPVDRKFAAPEVIDKAGVAPMIERWRDPVAARQALDELAAHWSELLGRMTIETPDPHTNRMVNVWNAYQCVVTYHMSRNASLFDTGVGRGMGFRDSNQDLLGLFGMIPEKSRERILDLAATQLASGGAYHQYQPLTGRGNDAIGSGFNDDPLWLVLSTAAYVKETGDWPILDEPVVYENEPGTETPLFEHLERSIRYTLDRLGPHGLPLIGRADWNDCLNLNTFSAEPGESFQTHASTEGGVAESIFIAAQFVLAATEMAELADRIGRSSVAATYRDEADRMATVVAEHGWDGEWWLRAYDHRGDPVGSRVCDEGKIFVEVQGMAIMAGLGLDDGSAERALTSVADHLATPHGIALVRPPYTSYRIELGEISSYPPGYKENGSVFCHTNPWVSIAAAMTGDGDAAHDYYLRINPSVREAISEVHRSEPYVYAQTIAGPDAATFGEAKNSWLTGTTAWSYVAITQWILGIRPDHDGLIVAPVIPVSWEGFSAVRWFRGAEYRIEARRHGPGTQVALFVDGVPIDGAVVPPGSGPGPIEVRAEIG
jgi:cellobiose phosphorylase